MKLSRKIARNLEQRRHAYSMMMSERSLHGGIQQRKDTGGYHRPGANKRK